MIEFIKNLFSKPDDESANSVIQNSDATFVLKIDDKEVGEIVIGTLEFRNNFWIFKYSEAFKQQQKYRRLVGFSDLDKMYKREVLWPFFKIRIPGLKQPLVQKILEEEAINKNDEVSLLKRFGKRSISNPYLLEIA